jgi:hypothetical protein
MFKKCLFFVWITGVSNFSVGSRDSLSDENATPGQLPTICQLTSVFTQNAIISAANKPGLLSNSSRQQCVVLALNKEISFAKTHNTFTVLRHIFNVECVKSAYSSLKKIRKSCCGFRLCNNVDDRILEDLQDTKRILINKVRIMNECFPRMPVNNKENVDALYNWQIGTVAHLIATRDNVASIQTKNMDRISFFQAITSAEAEPSPALRIAQMQVREMVHAASLPTTRTAS